MAVIIRYDEDANRAATALILILAAILALLLVYYFLVQRPRERELLLHIGDMVYTLEVIEER